MHLDTLPTSLTEWVRVAHEAELEKAKVKHADNHRLPDDQREQYRRQLEQVQAVIDQCQNYYISLRIRKDKLELQGRLLAQQAVTDATAESQLEPLYDQLDVIRAELAEGEAEQAKLEKERMQMARTSRGKRTATRYSPLMGKAVKSIASMPYTWPPKNRRRLSPRFPKRK